MLSVWNSMKIYLLKNYEFFDAIILYFILYFSLSALYLWTTVLIDPNRKQNKDLSHQFSCIKLVVLQSGLVQNFVIL